ncbi:hypothetical protein RJ640_002292 [Escallonia rubra]|uniref:Pentatricopeptide repeat-containing protein n=1 Tax=Escallonia rubra TaxID=112253 RepID=A0AA88RUP5_9ASTE|nr:hypothetical protein RJ640_002292 [Escallonia rubra]
MGFSVSPYAMSTMLSCLVDYKCINVILDVNAMMVNGLRQEWSPYLNLYNFVIVGFFKKDEVEMGLEFHRARIERGFVPKILVCNKILRSLCNENSMGIAHDFLSLILEVGPNSSVMTFNTLLNAFCKELRLEYAFELYDLTIARGIDPDLVIYSILVNSLSNSRKLEGRRLILVALDRGINLDVVILSSILDASIRGGDFLEGIDIGAIRVWDQVVYLNGGTAGLSIFKLMLKNGVYPDIAVYNVLITIFFKEGRVKNALELFRQVSEVGPKLDFLMDCALDMHLLPIQMTYGILIHVYCKVARLSEALVFCNRMLEDDIMPDNCIQETFSKYKLLNCEATDSAFN